MKRHSFKVFFIGLLLLSRVQAQPGSIDTTFITQFDFTAGQQVSVLHALPNGDILAGGNFIFSLIDGFKIGNFIKYDSSGKFNHKWNQGKGFDRFVRNIFPVEQDKLLIIGDFLKYHDTDCGRLARLNKDYSLDLTYKVPVYQSVISAGMQSDGKIILRVFIAGNSALVRLKKDGNVDSTFKEMKPSNLVSLFIQSDDKILITGNVFPNGIMRLSKDGGTDGSFNPAAHKLTNLVTAAIQSDGKILIAGSDPAFKVKLARLNSNGSLDTTFKPISATDVGSTITAIFIQKDQKIILGGRFVYENKKKYNNIVRLNSDGTIDTTFVIGTGFSSFVNTIVPYGDDKILVGGNFTSYNGDLASRIIRLNLNEKPILPAPKVRQLSISPNPVHNQLNIETTDTISTVTITDALGRETLRASPNLNQFSINMEDLASGLYFVKLRSENETIIRKILRN